MKKLQEIRFYPLIAILGVAAILFVFRMPMFKPTQPIIESHSGNTIQLDSKAFGEALKDTCELKLSRNKLSGSPEIISSIMQGVDTLTLKKVTDKSITFNENGGIEVPAAVITNMVDLGLVKPYKEQCDENQ